MWLCCNFAHLFGCFVRHCKHSTCLCSCFVSLCCNMGVFVVVLYLFGCFVCHCSHSACFCSCFVCLCCNFVCLCGCFVSPCNIFVVVMHLCVRYCFAFCMAVLHSLTIVFFGTSFLSDLLCLLSSFSHFVIVLYPFAVFSVLFLLFWPVFVLIWYLFIVVFASF